MRSTLAALVAGFAAAFTLDAAGADIVDSFDNNTDQGAWRLTSNPDRLYRIEPTGGNPGPYLHGQVSTAVPTWYISNPTANPFLGSYTALGVRSFSCDLQFTGGSQVPDRNVTLHLLTTLGTGDPVQGIEAYFVGPDISVFPIGWRTYSYPLDASTASIPAGWVVTEGNGSPGTSADWQNLLTHIEDVHIALGTPGFFYPTLGIWDIGLDNVRLTTIPAPGAALLAILPFAVRRRR